jgi:hypothetical protein
MPKNEYRCTRPDLYNIHCQGHFDKSARQGHYVIARNKEEARQVMKHDFPGERIDVEDCRKTVPDFVTYDIDRIHRLNPPS